MSTLAKRISSQRGAMSQLARFSTAVPPRRGTMQSSVNDYAGVMQSLAHYCDALHTNDAQRMGQVWHERSHLRRPSGDGGVVSIDAPTFFGIVSSPSKAVAGAPALPWLADRVVAVDFASPETAMAKVEIVLNATAYTDYLALLRLRDGWKIVAKCFASRPCSIPGSIDTTPHETCVNEVGAAVAKYFSARRNADSTLMGALLHPSCQLLGARRDNGELCEVDRELFVGRTGGAHKPTPAGVGASKWDRIVSIDKSGPDTALAKLHIGYHVTDLAIDPSAPPGPRMFTDYLQLIRVAGGWSIVARIYSAVDAVVD